MYYYYYILYYIYIIYHCILTMSKCLKHGSQPLHTRPIMTENCLIQDQRLLSFSVAITTFYYYLTTANAKNIWTCSYLLFSNLLTFVQQSVMMSSHFFINLFTPVQQPVHTYSALVYTCSATCPHLLSNLPTPAHQCPGRNVTKSGHNANCYTEVLTKS